MRHQPDPWKVGEFHERPPGEITDADGQFVVGPGAFVTQANAARIVACVNACAGMEDPGAEIDLQKQLCDAGMKLSTYAAAIHWDSTPNTEEWKAGLEERIEDVQELADQLCKVRLNMPRPIIKTPREKG